MGKLRSMAGRSRQRLQVHLRTAGPIGRAVYYSVFSDAFGRERRLVATGHREYLRRLDDGSQEFLLRRNVHMLEKGLTMRPRRASFGAAYVEETVGLLASMRDLDPPVLDRPVLDWAREVLERFVEATATSDDPRVQAARARYATLSWNSERNPASGPHAPHADEPPVDIDSLYALSRRRKSVRWFEPRTVAHEVIDRAMLVAAEAPSACNRQPFSFRIFDDPDMVASVAAIPMGTAGYAHNLPGIAVIVGDQSAFIDERDRHLIYTDGCLAAMSFILGLEAQGVASVCINWPDISARDKKMSALLGLGSHERVVMLVGFGYADASGDTPHSAKRSLPALRSYNTL